MSASDAVRRAEDALRIPRAPLRRALLALAGAGVPLAAAAELADEALLVLPSLGRKRMAYLREYVQAVQSAGAAVRRARAEWPGLDWRPAVVPRGVPAAVAITPEGWDAAGDQGDGVCRWRLLEAPRCLLDVIGLSG